jgi:hypothetical protein
VCLLQNFNDRDSDGKSGNNDQEPADRVAAQATVVIDESGDNRG